MTSQLAKIPLAELCTAITSGGTPSRKEPEFWNGGTIPWIKTGELSDWKVSGVGEHITPLGLEKSAAKILPSGTILMAMYGDGRTITTLGIVDEPSATNQACCAFLVDPDKCDNLYLFYALKHHRHELLKLVVAGAQRNLSTGIIKRFPVPFRPIEEQRRIAATLSAYDDLIENNRRRIALLEDAARQLYKEWFVHFRFPGHEHVVITDGVPEGWEIGKLSDIVTTNQKSFSAKNLPETLRYIDISAVNKGEIAANVPIPSSEAPGRARRIAAHGDVIWSNVRPNLRAYALVLNPDEIDVFSTGFTVLSSCTLPYSFLYVLTTTDAFVSYLVNQTTGASYPAVRPDDFERADVVVPTPPVLSAFHEMCAPNFELAALLRQQSNQLSKARDLLLPKLMNGTLTV